MKILIIYIIVINIVSFITMFIDKRLAIAHKRRVSEKTLFTLAFLLGSFGIYASMFTFRHKTKHKSFLVGIPLIFLVNIATIYYFIVFVINIFNN